MTPGGAEEFVTRGSGQIADVHDGVLTLDHLTPERASVVALTIAQSAAMEYYEGAVEQMFEQTGRRVERLEDRGTVSFRTKPLHRFIGSAVATRSEVLSVLHLFDKPDEAWDDTGMDRIYDELRAEFDLVDCYQAMETKLRTMQESLELILDVARDRRLVSLEVTIVILIGFEISGGVLAPVSDAAEDERFIPERSVLEAALLRELAETWDEIAQNHFKQAAAASGAGAVRPRAPPGRMDPRAADHRDLAPAGGHAALGRGARGPEARDRAPVRRRGAAHPR